MPDITTRTAPSAERLWALDDLNQYIGCCDARPVSKLPGFPPEMHLPGVRGPRWYPAGVITFFAAAGQPTTSSCPPEEPEPAVRLPKLSAAAVASAIGAA